MTGDTYSATYIPSLCFFWSFWEERFIDVSSDYSTWIASVFLIGLE